jgi:hypothetical protein
MDCIVVDIDGTVADLNHRRHLSKKGALFFENVDFDSPIDTVITIVQAIRDSGVKLIFLSGRDSFCRTDTVRWLSKHVGHYDGLLMRRSGDRRLDNVVKEELIKFVTIDYTPILMIDDRNSIVDLWLKLGYPVWQTVPRTKTYLDDGNEDTRYDHGDF